MTADTQGNHEPTAERFHLLSVKDLFALRQPKWLIDGIVTEGAFGSVFGPSGDGKSFLALDWSLSVASGCPWQGRRVQQGEVVYVAAEGGLAINKRVAAWMQQHALSDVPSAFFLLEGVQVADEEELDLLLRKLAERSMVPCLIVLDTFARCFVGGEENSAKEVGEFIAGAARLHVATGATVLCVHHTGKGGKDIERGSSALRAAADVMVRVVKDKTTVTIYNDKQKDAAPFDAIKLRMQEVQTLVGQETTTSLVLLAAGADAASCAPETLPARSEQVLKMLAACAGGTATTAQLMVQGEAHRTFFHRVRQLQETGHVVKQSRGRYALTDKGRAMCGTAARATQVH